MTRRHVPARGERGMTLVELSIALVILAIGILAVGQVFPKGSRDQVDNRHLSTAGFYAQEAIESLVAQEYGDTELTDGRHPAGTATEGLAGGKYRRFYTVATLPTPLNTVKRIDVSVYWTGYGQSDTVTAVTYKRR
jgi:prepilin-type N-terminal cleavage/methylation domain-containing protein